MFSSNVYLVCVLVCTYTRLGEDIRKRMRVWTWREVFGGTMERRTTWNGYDDEHY